MCPADIELVLVRATEDRRVRSKNRPRAPIQFALYFNFFTGPKRVIQDYCKKSNSSRRKPANWTIPFRPS